MESPARKSNKGDLKTLRADSEKRNLFEMRIFCPSRVIQAEILQKKKEKKAIPVKKFSLFK